MFIVNIPTTNQTEAKTTNRITMPIRRIPSSGSNCCASKPDTGIVGKNGSYLRVRVDLESGIVEKIHPSSWTEKGNEQFKRQYMEVWMVPEGNNGMEVERLEWVQNKKNGIRCWRDMEGAEYENTVQEAMTSAGKEIDTHRAQEVLSFLAAVSTVGEIKEDTEVIQPAVVQEVVNDVNVCEEKIKKKKRTSYHFKNYTPEEDAIITDYMTKEHFELFNGKLREKKMAKKCRELAEQLNGRKPQNIQTRWERFLNPKYLQSLVNDRDAEIARLKGLLNAIHTMIN